MSVWHVRLADNEIKLYMGIPGLSWAKYTDVQGLSACYTLDHVNTNQAIVDISGNGNLGLIHNSNIVKVLKIFTDEYLGGS